MRMIKHCLASTKTVYKHYLEKASDPFHDSYEHIKVWLIYKGFNYLFLIRLSFPPQELTGHHRKPVNL